MGNNNMIDNKYDKATEDFIYKKTCKYNSDGLYGEREAINTAEYNRSIMANSKKAPAVSEKTGNTCTDGNDDGKIGFWGAAKSAVKGICKTVVNGVKGMFTNSEGKFSLGKTLLSAGLITACIAFPAVGLVVCGVGCVAGGATLAKGFYHAFTADTDAEAKDAWEDVGSGGLTLALSAAGAKASYNAVKSTSIATDGIAAMEENGTLANATFKEKAIALGKDMASSTSERWSAIKAEAGTYREVGALRKMEAEAKNLAKKGKSEEAIKLSKECQEKYLGLDEQGQTAYKNLEKVTLENAKNIAKTNGEKVWNGVKTTGEKYLEQIKHPVKNMENPPRGLTKIGIKIFNSIKDGLSYEKLVAKYGQTKVDNALVTIGAECLDNSI